jgi:hypothetical protein
MSDQIDRAEVKLATHLSAVLLSHPRGAVHALIGVSLAEIAGIAEMGVDRGDAIASKTRSRRSMRVPRRRTASTADRSEVGVGCYHELTRCMLRLFSRSV